MRGSFLTYDKVRDQIQDGDLIFLSGMPKSFFSFLVQIFTLSPIYHVGIAFWYKDRLMIVDTDLGAGGKRIINLSTHADRRFVVVRPHVDWAAMEKPALARTGIDKYSKIDLVLVWVGTFINHKWNSKGDICSEMVAEIINEANGKDVIQKTLITPKQLFNKIMNDLGYKLIVWNLG